MILPVIASAFCDRRLRPSDYRVYGYALTHLDLVDFRPLKGRAAARVLEMRNTHVARSLRRLVTFGYLERRTSAGRQLRSYRLRLSLPESVTSKAA